VISQEHSAWTNIAAPFNDDVHWDRPRYSFPVEGDANAVSRATSAPFMNAFTFLDANKWFDLNKYHFLRFIDRLALRLGPTYVAPNERNPRKSFSILKQAPNGVYVAVGTERGFIGAAATPNASHLLLADTDESTVLFNRLNVILLKLSKDRTDYIHLREKADFYEWSRRATEAELTADERTLMANHKVFYFWSWHVRNFFFLRAYSVWSLLPSTFYFSHYMFNNERFRHIQEMAKLDRIKAVPINLSDTPKVERLVEALSTANLRLSILDLSNAWWRAYIDRSSLVALVKKFAQISTDQSIFMITSDANIWYLKQIWKYFGFRLKEVASEDNLNKALNGDRRIHGYRPNKLQNVDSCEDIF